MFAVSLRSGWLWVAMAVVAAGSTAFAQQTGDSMAAIERTLGQPAIALNRGGNVIWSYANGRKVTFRKGVAIEVTAPVVETKRNDFDDEEEVRAPVRPVASVPASRRDDAAMLSRRAADLAPHHVGVIEWALRVIAIAVGVVTWTVRRPFQTRTTPAS